jgi:hypothetical protein
MEKIIQEKISADHLLYVSLKYTKTTEVMLNLLERWQSLMENAINQLLKKAKSKKKISSISTAPKIKLEQVKKVYKKNKNITEAVEILEFFKKMPIKEKIRENEFRKNVVLRVKEKGEWISIDMDKLKEYNDIVERFIREIKQIL